MLGKTVSNSTDNKRFVIKKDATMAARECECPSCNAHLRVPDGEGNRQVRCGKCGNIFQLPRRLNVTEDAVANWLFEDEEQAAAAAGAPTGMASASPSAAAAPAHAHGAASAPTPAPAARRAAAAHFNCQLTRIDRKGVLLDFPASYLKETIFRCAMPRRCLQCGSRLHLQAHVVIYAPTLTSSVSLEAEHNAGKMVLVLTADEVKNLTPEQFLTKMPLVPNIPPPGNLPMPYWLCDMCGNSGAISGQIEINSKTGQGRCKLLIGNLWRAEEFLCGVDARETPCYAEVAKRIAATQENPWDHLPLVVQNRLQQWYKAAPSEVYCAYVPDRDHARTEDGMFGVVLSDRRFVCHTKLRHHEINFPGALEFRQKPSNLKNKVHVHIQAPQWESQVTLENEGITTLRRALAKAQCTANWK